MNYQKLLKDHLSRYKVENLGIIENGKWRNNKPYSHILHKLMQDKNIIEHYRTQFWEYFEKADIKLHSDFHHLNSSQAMCFNLFFPFMHEKKMARILSLMKVKCPNEPIESRFEYVPDPGKEKTNYDFWVNVNDRMQVFFEFKLSESHFGGASYRESALKRLNDIYAPKLKNYLPAECLEPDFYIANYQIIRNFYHLRPDANDQVMFVYPYGNKSLRKQETAIKQCCEGFFKNRARTIYIEELTDKLLHEITEPDTLAEHCWEFARKYCPETDASYEH